MKNNTSNDNFSSDLIYEVGINAFLRPHKRFD